MNLLYFKHRMVGTPAESLANTVRQAVAVCKGWRWPQRREIYREEARIRQVMARLITPDSNCIDIGCHIGSTLAHMIKLAPVGQHWAFEAVQYKADWLKRKFPRVQVRHLALSDAPGEVVFQESLTHPGYSGVGQRHGQHQTHQWKSTTVPAARLDDVIPTDHHVHFIKMDVEGSESRIFEGARQTLARCQPVVLFESSMANARRANIHVGDLYDTVRSCGYDVCLPQDYLADRGPVDRAGFEAAQQYPFKAFNYVALPKA